jgi:phosphatidylinositol phospholipase C delta
MAQDMEQVFGSKLFIPSQEQIGINKLPSPEELRGKIVIKGKRPPELDDNPDDEDEEGDADDPYSDQYKDTPSVATKDPKKLPKVVPELAKLTQFNGNKFKNFQKSIQQNPSHMHSFGESKITKIINKDKANANFWREYNVTHMSRTYPAGIRVDSSNYSPILAWSVGCRKL